MQRFFLKKQYCFLLLLLFNFSAIAQVKKDTISINYSSGNINVKNKKLKVGSFVFIKIDSLPKGYKVNAVANFENGNLENGSMFGSMLNRDLEKYKEDNTLKNNYTAPDTSTTKEAKKFIDSINKNAAKDTTLINQFKGNKSLDANPTEEQKTYKIDIFNLSKKVEVGAAKNFVSIYRKDKDENSKGYKAYLDLKWQEWVLKIADSNIIDYKRIKDSIISKYAAKIDSLNLINFNLKQITDSLTPKYISKNLLGIQIPNTDFTDIRIEVKDDKNNIVNEIPLTYNNVGGFKLDFSVGFFNSLYETFNYKVVQKDTIINNNAVPVDSIYRVAQNSNGTSNISFGILAHGYWRTGEYFSPGISSGFTYTPATKNLNFLIGASALLGRKQRLIITSGIAFNKVKELAYYQTNKFYKQTILNPNTIGDLPTSEKTKSSWFFGLSYNLGIVNNGKASTKVF